MNTQFEFLDYVTTPNEKHLGIATIRAWGKVILRYKIVAGKDGRGFFASPASYKTGTGPDGKDMYEKCFLIDSNYENSQAEACIRANVNPYASNSPQNAQGSQNSTWGSGVVQSNQQNYVQNHQYPNSPIDTSHLTRGPTMTPQKPVFGQNQQQPVGQYFTHVPQDEDIPF